MTLRDMLGNKLMLAFTGETPYDLRAYPQTTSHLCTYAILPPSMTASANALFGRAPISGRLPVTIAGIAPFGAGERGE